MEDTSSRGANDCGVLTQGSDQLGGWFSESGSGLDSFSFRTQVHWASIQVYVGSEHDWRNTYTILTRM